MEMWNYIKKILFSKHKRVHVDKRFTSTLIIKLKTSLAQNKAIQFYFFTKGKQVKQQSNIK